MLTNSQDYSRSWKEVITLYYLVFAFLSNKFNYFSNFNSSISFFCILFFVSYKYYSTLTFAWWFTNVAIVDLLWETCRDKIFECIGSWKRGILLDDYDFFILERFE